MTVERTLDDAHKLLSQGKVDGAIAAYAGLLETRPDDWPAANRLGDLYLHAGKIDEALEQFNHVAQHLFDRHLLPKAAAVYKKVLKVAPHDEYARLQLADISEQRGFLVEARTHLDVIMGLRRDSDDAAGADEIAERLRQLGGAHVKRGSEPTPATPAPRQSESWEVDRALLFDPDADPKPAAAAENATVSAGSAASAGPPQEAAQPTAQDRQLQLKMMLIENEFRASRFKRAGQLMGTMLSASLDGTAQVLDLAKRIATEQPEATVICAEVLLEAAAERDDWRSMTSAVAELATWAQSLAEGGQWPAELTERLARAESSARLETTRREQDHGRQALPEIENGGGEYKATDVSPEPAVAAAV